MTVIRPHPMRTCVSAILMILLFPGFYLYNAGLSDGLYPQFFGGWYGPISFAIGMPYLLYLVIELVKHKGRFDDRIGMFLCVTVVYFAIWATGYTLLEPNKDGGSEVYFYTIEYLMLWSVTFVTFKYFDYESPRLAWTIFVLWVAMFLIAIMGQHHGMYYAASEAVINDDLRISSYQGFARSALVTSALILVRLRGLKAALLGCGALGLLFLLGARTEFIGVIIIILVSFIGGRGHWLAKVGVLILSVAIICISGNTFFAIFRWLSNK